MIARLLLAGVPGTGKTTVACYLASKYGYVHVDMEERGFEARYRLSQDPARFLAGLPAGRVIVSWGFGPFSDLRSIRHLTGAGCVMVWLDGDRVAAFREFMRREGNNPVSEYNYYGQMQMIVATEVVQRMNPPVVNPFGPGGLFRPVGDIAADILRAAQAASAGAVSMNP